MFSFVHSFGSIVWLKEDSCDILIYDSCGSDDILRCLPLNTRVLVLPVRDGYCAIKSVFFFAVFWFYFIKTKRVKIALAASVVRVWAPKVVITFIDNSGDLGVLKALFPSSVMISVQNGTRWDLSRPHRKSLSFDRYFCFGEMEKDILLANGDTYNYIYPVGSLRLDSALADMGSLEANHGVCFISQFDPINNESTKNWSGCVALAYYELSWQLAKIVSEFSKINGLRFFVALRHPPGSRGYEDECRYYRQKVGQDVDLIPNVGFSSYQVALESKLSVTISSTLGYEALGVGNRVIFGKDIDGVDALTLKGSWEQNFSTSKLPELQRLRTLSAEEFSLKASALLAMSDEEYVKHSDCARSYYMDFHADALPHKRVMDQISCALEAS